MTKPTTLDPLMAQCTNTKTKDGSISISCKLGFWAVSGRDKAFVMNSARHYFGQYLRDGEYRALLASDPA